MTHHRSHPEVPTSTPSTTGTEHEVTPERRPEPSRERPCKKESTTGWVPPYCTGTDFVGNTPTTPTQTDRLGLPFPTLPQSHRTELGASHYQDVVPERVVLRR